ncbi:rubrerythrin-like domain-containing protein [Halostella sp. JP-L12]|nr:MULTISPECIES: rubrerythrin-like domain-containing protein [Halostella]NHN46425.1 rubrerythrin-like domain-containing protein [Halostella sp. JP-L12]
MTRDVTYEADEEYEYECLGCGETLTASSHPGSCSECGAGLRNRRIPYE